MAKMKERSIQERKVPFSLRWGKTIPTRLAEDGCGKKGKNTEKIPPP